MSTAALERFDVVALNATAAQERREGCTSQQNRGEAVARDYTSIRAAIHSVNNKIPVVVQLMIREQEQTLGGSLRSGGMDHAFEIFDDVMDEQSGERSYDVLSVGRRLLGAGGEVISNFIPSCCCTRSSRRGAFSSTGTAVAGLGLGFIMTGGYM